MKISLITLNSIGSNSINLSDFPANPMNLFKLILPAGTLNFIAAVHCSLRHDDCVALVVVGECRQDNLWWVGCMGKFPMGKAFIAGFTEKELDLIFF